MFVVNFTFLFQIRNKGGTSLRWKQEYYEPANLGYETYNCLATQNTHTHMNLDPKRSNVLNKGCSSVWRVQ
jgi:hypothetical protein